MNVADRIIKLERKVQEILSKLMNIRAIATTLGHHATHESGGADPIKLDDLAAPDDNTDLDVATNKHGLAPKRDGDATHALLGDATWGHPKGSAHQGDHREGGADELPLDKLALPADDTDDTLLCSTTRKGLLKKLPNDDTLYINGIGNWSAPGGGPGGGAPADAQYIVGAADGDLSAERVKKALYLNDDPDDEPASPDSIDDEFDNDSLDAKWTITNNPATRNWDETTFTGFLSCVIPETAVADSFENYHRIHQSGVPAYGTAWEITAKVCLTVVEDSAVTEAGEWADINLYLGNLTNKQFVSACLQTNDASPHSVNNPQALHAFHDNGAGVIAAMTTDKPKVIDPSSWVYLRLKKTTTAAYTSANTYEAWGSKNGFNFFYLGQCSHTFTADPDEIGIMCRPPKAQGGTPSSKPMIDWFRKTG